MKSYILFIFLVILSSSVSGQINSDSLFSSAISHSHAKKYDKALEEASTVLSLDTNRYDVMVFMANVLAWQGNYTKALDYIHKADALNPNDKELYDAWLNILLWSKDYDQLLKTTQVAEKHDYPDKYNIAMKRLLAYRALGRYNEGIEYIKSQPQYLDSAKVKAVYNILVMSKQKNALTAFYSLDVFGKNSPKPQHLAYIDYQLKINEHNSFFFRLNYASRFGQQDVQPEVEYYHFFGNGRYLYSDYGYGIKHTLFPTHRIGLEFFLPFAKTYEASLGGRIFIYDTSSVYIITGHIGKYIKNFWLSFRPYYVLGQGNHSLTLVLKARMFAEDPINYWGVELGYGNSPDERNQILPSAEILRLHAYRILAEKNLSLSKISELKFQAGYAYEEYNNTLFRNRYTFVIIYKYKF